MTKLYLPVYVCCCISVKGTPASQLYMPHLKARCCTGLIHTSLTHFSTELSTWQHLPSHSQKATSHQWLYSAGLQDNSTSTHSDFICSMPLFHMRFPWGSNSILIRTLWRSQVSVNFQYRHVNLPLQKEPLSTGTLQPTTSDHPGHHLTTTVPLARSNTLHDHCDLG